MLAGADAGRDPRHPAADDGRRPPDGRAPPRRAPTPPPFAAATSLYENYTSDQGLDPSYAATVALDSAAANGYANDKVNSVVTVNIPPTSGEFKGKAEYVEVIIQWNLQGGFSAALNRKNIVAKARSRRAAGPTWSAWSSSPRERRHTGQQIDRRALVGLYVNSSDPDAFEQKSPGILVVDGLEITGGYNNSGGALSWPDRYRRAGPVLGHPAQHRRSQPGRLSGAEQRTAQDQHPLPVPSSPWRLQGGHQHLGSVRRDHAARRVHHGRRRLQGVFAAASVVGVGTVIYNTSGSFPAGSVSIASLGKVALIAPWNGTYKGIGIFQDRALNNAMTITGNGLSTIGVIYARAASSLTMPPPSASTRWGAPMSATRSRSAASARSTSTSAPTGRRSRKSTWWSSNPHAHDQEPGRECPASCSGPKDRVVARPGGTRSSPTA
ncbi:MAG: hypothetical protein U0793_17395 [Gemmataceae bacterium]